MLAKMTAKNQLTLPKSVADQFDCPIITAEQFLKTIGL